MVTEVMVMVKVMVKVKMRAIKTAETKMQSDLTPTKQQVAVVSMVIMVTVVMIVIVYKVCLSEETRVLNER